MTQQNNLPHPRGHELRAWLREGKALTHLAVPMAATQVAQMVVLTTDTLIIGRLGADELAAGAVGFTYETIGWMLSIGPLSAIAPIIAQRLGADPTDTRETRRTMRMGLWLVAFMAIPLLAFFLAAPPVLRLFGQSEEIISLAGPYILALYPALILGLAFQALRNTLAALSFTRAALVIALAMIAINVVLVYGLVHGHFGFPRLELIGAGLGSSIAGAVSFLAMLGWIKFWPTFKRYHFFEHLWRPDWAKLAEMLKLGGPIGLTLFFEASLFQAGVFMMGNIGTAELAAHQIAINVASVTFMVPLGLSQAATVRVGLAAGARNMHAAQRAALTAVGLGACFMLATAVLMFVFPRQIAGLYIDASDPANAAVIGHAATFLMLAAAFQVFDSSQVTGSGALRGLKDTRVPAILAGISYWLIGFPTAIGLGFFTALAGAGIWIGFCVGLAAAATLMVGRVIHLTRRPPAAASPEPEALAEAA